MKIAIHLSDKGFSKSWIKHCEDNNISFKVVNCYDNNIIEIMKEFDCLLWNWDHANPKDVLFARQLTYSLDAMKKKVFPDIRTCWHFDDKVGQKYLLEALGVPLVNSYVFYDKKEALDWAEKTEFPKVFKLRGGAGSYNVKLAKTKEEAKKFIKTAFGKGFKSVPGYMDDFKTKAKRISSLGSFLSKLKRAPGIILQSIYANKMMGRERGYVYFQDFVPDNNYDIRVVVIGEKAFALKRLCRENDFRASGSGKIIYDKNQIDERCIKIAFDVSEKAGFQCMAYDFVFNSDNPLIVEISYGFVHKAYEKCEGVWDKNLVWNDEPVYATEMIIKSVCGLKK